MSSVTFYMKIPASKGLVEACEYTFGVTPQSNGQFKTVKKSMGSYKSPEDADAFFKEKNVPKERIVSSTAAIISIIDPTGKDIDCKVVQILCNGEKPYKEVGVSVGGKKFYDNVATAAQQYCENKREEGEECVFLGRETVNKVHQVITGNKGKR